MNLSTITRLPICPRPNPQEESLTNYCLRVSELNGYRTPQMLLTIAGLGRRVNVAADAADKLGPLLNVDRTVLKEMAYAHRPHDAQAKWKRGQQRFRSHEVTPRLSRICPDCLKELGYARAIWDIRLVVACRKHNTLLLSECPACAKPLTWIRPGLLMCSCGHRLGDDARPLSPEWTVRIASLIEHAVYGNEQMNDADFTWCPPAIRDLPIEELLSFLTYWMTISARLAVSGVDEILRFRTSFDVVRLSPVVNTVGRAIAEWPLSHSRVIARLVERHGCSSSSHVGPARLRHALGNMWLWAQSDMAPAVLRNEIKTYLTERKIYQSNGRVGYLHPRHIIPFTPSNQVKKGVGLVQGFELLGISESLFRTLIEREVIKKLGKTLPSRSVALFDIESILSIKPLIEATCDNREAAKRLALSAGQFAALVNHGLLEVVIGKKGVARGSRFRMNDLIALNSRFANLVLSTNQLVNSNRIQVKAFPVTYGISRKREFAPLMKAILDGKVPVASPPTGTQSIGDYLLDVRDLADAGFSICRVWGLKPCRPCADPRQQSARRTQD